MQDQEDGRRVDCDPRLDTQRFGCVDPSSNTRYSLRWVEDTLARVACESFRASILEKRCWIPAS